MADVRHAARRAEAADPGRVRLPKAESIADGPRGLLGYVKSLAQTMMEAHDRLYVQTADYARTIPIPTLGVGTTAFDLSPERKLALYDSGRFAAEGFLKDWNFEAYVEAYRRARALAAARRGGRDDRGRDDDGVDRLDRGRDEAPVGAMAPGVHRDGGRPDGCVFAEAAGELPEADSLVVHRGERCLVLLNKFPYLGPPARGAGPPRGRLRRTRRRRGPGAARTGCSGMTALDAVYAPHGYNLGWNLGRVAGAASSTTSTSTSPRWGGDTNFMPVSADVKVLPSTCARPASAWAQPARLAGLNPSDRRRCCPL